MADPLDPIDTPGPPHAPDPRDSLDAQAAAFAQLIKLSGAPEAAFRSAVALADRLFPHQIEGVAFLLGRRRAILADDMGLGKTRQAIVSLRHLAPAGPRLVVCPASVKQNWAREIAVVTPDASLLVIEGAAPIPLTAEWVIVNYDILGRHVDDLLRMPWTALVFDEAHYLKNHTSARSKLSRQLTTTAATATPALAVQLLTGTPLTSRPRDLFVLLQLAAHPLGRSFLSFAKRYCAAEKGEYGWKTGGASNIEELTVQLHGIMLRRSKDDVIALPPKLRTWLPVAVPSGTGARAIKKVFELLTGKDTRPAPSRDVEFRRRGKLLAFLVEARQALAIAKAAATIDFVKGAIDQGEKVVVFSCFDIPIQKLANEFGDAAIVVTGKTPAAMRQPLVDRFQNDPAARVFVANIVAGGIGLNLTAATQVVFNDLDWVPTNHWQAEDRAYRIGQTRTVNVTYFVARDTIDDFVQAVLERKATLINAIVEGTALAPDAGGDVLDELQRILHTISKSEVDGDSVADDDDGGNGRDKDDGDEKDDADADAGDGMIARLLRRASEEFRIAHRADPDRPAAAARGEREVQALARALEALVKVLSGPSARRFRISSTSHAGVDYEIVAVDADVTCTCPGFEYRGQCRHARDVKAALAAGEPVPAQYVEMNTPINPA
jgi:SWI/SNF-related matrix-associated actin-dependent regulator of chromatin subfamily A-like protein 1